jgi:predicted naringenin-chalcone synthase
MSDIFIKSVSCVIPGYTDSEDGALVSTSKILSNIKCLNTTNQRSFEDQFIKNHIGIETVALSNSSLEFCEKYWDNPKTTPQEVFNAAQSTPNKSLSQMVNKAMVGAVKSLKTKEASEDSRFIAHIHICGFFSPFMEFSLVKMRDSMNIGKSSLQTLFLQQGCSGLLTALNVANTLLAGSPKGSNVLITAENNMMIHAHQRCTRIARVDNINNWLWPVIFGEGAGAMVVGTVDVETLCPGSVFFSIDHTEQETIENEWRVFHNWIPEEKTTEVIIKAKEVRDTYMRGIKKYATRAIEWSQGLDSLFQVCLHESNPKMIVEMRKQLGVPSEMVPSISAQVGTLACVSAFSLLDLAVKGFGQQTEASIDHKQRSKIAIALIGEAGDKVIAGNICLSARSF